MTRNEARQIVHHAPIAIATMSMVLPDSLNITRWERELKDAIALLGAPVDPTWRRENV